MLLPSVRMIALCKNASKYCTYSYTAVFCEVKKNLNNPCINRVNIVLWDWNESAYKCDGVLDSIIGISTWSAGCIP
jgi:hypothetical protein